MADFAPPTGPPPPKVPEGWKAIWNEQYNEWFYVNIYTKQSQWEKPTEPIYPSGNSDLSSSDAPPPGYDHGTARPVGPEKQPNQPGSNNPFTSDGSAGASNQLSEDEKLARKLQEEENRQTGGFSSSGAAGGYYSQPGQNPPASAVQAGELPPRPDADRGSKGKGILGKILGKVGKQPQQQQQYYPQGGQGYYSQPGYAPPGYPPQGYPPQAGYYPPGRPGRRPGGLGAGGAAALGVGGGLMGGMLLGSALDGGDHGGDYGGDDGGDFGGGDFGGGDFGGGDF